MIALLLLLTATFGGALLAKRLDPETERLSETLALGTAVGLALLAAAGFVLGWGFGLTRITVTVSALLVVTIGLAVGAAPRELWKMRRRPRSVGVIVLSILSALLVAQLAERTLIETPEGIATGARHNFGDLPFHMAISAGFVFAHNFPPDHPELAGVPLTYPFFGDVVSAMILAASGSWTSAFFWPALFLGLSVIVALVRFGEAVTGSRPLGRVAAALTFFSGGLGFLDLTNADSVTRWWTTGPDATITDTGLRYANFVITLFIPQRSILFGWPLLFFGLSLVVLALKKTDTPDRASRSWLHAGVVVSLLPLVHAHSFAVGCFCALVLALGAAPRRLIAFVKGVLPLSVPALVFMASHNSLATNRFFAWMPGFDGGADSPIRYWLMNAGLFLPLVFAGAIRARSSSVLRVVAAPFAVLFLAANLFRLSPWMWDNMKFLAPAHAGLAPFAALALGFLWTKGTIGRIVSACMFVVAILSGAMDVSKVAFSGSEYEIFDGKALSFAEKIRETTPADAVILTADRHNHPVLLSGRRLYLGYEGHLWSQGLNYMARKPVAEAVLRGDLDQNDGRAGPRIDAIAVTPAEAGLVDELALQGLPSLVDSPYRLIKVR